MLPYKISYAGYICPRQQRQSRRIHIGITHNSTDPLILPRQQLRRLDPIPPQLQPGMLAVFVTLYQHEIHIPQTMQNFAQFRFCSLLQFPDMRPAAR